MCKGLRTGDLTVGLIFVLGTLRGRTCWSAAFPTPGSRWASGWETSCSPTPTGMSHRRRDLKRRGPGGLTSARPAERLRRRGASHDLRVVQAPKRLRKYDIPGCRPAADNPRETGGDGGASKSSRELRGSGDHQARAAQSGIQSLPSKGSADNNSHHVPWTRPCAGARDTAPRKPQAPTPGSSQSVSWKKQTKQS